jgi:acyl-CoA oxidase
LEDVGCSALTELGYGNNAVEMQTTATYDSETDELIVNTPHPLAQKYWIANGAVHAKHAVVMAQLFVRKFVLRTLTISTVSTHDSTQF